MFILLEKDYGGQPFGRLHGVPSQRNVTKSRGLFRAVTCLLLGKSAGSVRT